MVSKNKNFQSALPEPEIIALNVLTWLSGEPELLSRFLALSGLQIGQITDAARDPAFLGGVLDFIMEHEPDLLRFSAENGISPELVAGAWQRLSGPGLDSGQY